MTKKWITRLALLAVLVVTVAQCGATPTPQVIVNTVEVAKTVEVVQTVEVVNTVEVVKEITATPEPAKPKGTLTIALATNPNTLDAPLCAERNCQNVAGEMYDSLDWIDDDGKVVPALAESWDISSDGLTYTFHLRKDVTFHNGEPFNADSVVFSWNRYKSKDLQWNERWNLASNVEKIDDSTVKISTTEPNPLLLRTIAYSWQLVPPQYFQQVGADEFAKNPVGTGPYTFVEWVQGDHITLKANPNYWREGYPKTETLIYRTIPESSTRAAAIQTGEVDIAGRLTAEEAQSLLGAPGVQVISYPVARIYYIAFNNMTTGLDKPTMDANVRLAMNYAVDVQAIIDSIFEGFAKRAEGYIATGELGYGAVEPFPYDVAKAKELLATAGYPNGFSMDMACPAGAYSHFEEVCQAIVAYLDAVGIKINLNIMESGQYWDLEAKKELPPLFGDSWSAPIGEAWDRMAGALLGKDAAYSSWSDPKIIDLLGQVSQTIDDAKRTKLYQDLEVYMHSNPPFIFLYEPKAFEAKREYVQDYKPRAAEEYFLWYTYTLKP